MDNISQHHSDSRFPYVLVISMLGTVLSFVGVWVTNMPIA
jgi:hypothetical protein